MVTNKNDESVSIEVDKENLYCRYSNHKFT